MSYFFLFQFVWVSNDFKLLNDLNETKSYQLKLVKREFYKNVSKFYDSNDGNV